MSLASMTRTSESETQTLVRLLDQSLSVSQRDEVSLPWDAADNTRGLIRRFLANHWQVTRPSVRSSFYSDDQQALILSIFDSLLSAEWRPRVKQALRDDTKGHPWGQDQSIAILGTPGSGPWQFLFTGRHLTLRAQSDEASPFAFGGPLVYGHAATGFNETSGHPGNVYWPQAQAAGRVHGLLDARTRALAEVVLLPRESEIAFRERPQGAPVASFSPEARAAFLDLFDLLVQPFRAEDRASVRACVEAQGGIDSLHIAFARQPRMSAPLWDVWRIEGPAFVWHFQGWPHVHVWVHVASTPRTGGILVRHGAFLFPEHDRL